MQEKLDAHEFVFQNDLNTHNTSSTSHNDIRELISGLTGRLNALADSDDTTLDQLSEIVAYIKNNKTLIDNVTTSKVNVSDIVNELTSTAANKPLSANQGKILKELISELSTDINNRAARAFSTVAVGSTNIAADSNSDILTLIAGDNVELVPDADNDQITIHANSTSGVLGVKGNAETSYRTGNVNLTAGDIEALPSSGGTLTGDLRIKGSGNCGTKINLGDGDYVHISEPTDDCMEIKANEINFVVSDTSNFTLNGALIPSGFTPVQQGGGSGQLTNKVYLGWTGSSLKVQVDNVDMGEIVTTGSSNGHSVLSASKGGTGNTAGRATSVSDRTNGNTTYLNYGAACVGDFTYLSVWNGYELRAFHKNDVANAIGVVKRTHGGVDPTSSHTVQNGTYVYKTSDNHGHLHLNAIIGNLSAGTWTTIAKSTIKPTITSRAHIIIADGAYTLSGTERAGCTFNTAGEISVISPVGLTNKYVYIDVWW